jgi:hypothetical protein
MRKVFSSHEISEIALVRDALVQHGLGATVQNEHSGHSAVPAFRPPAEVWVSRDADYESAREIVVNTLALLKAKSDAPPWVCPNCREESPPSFDICWNCGRARDGVTDR